MERPARAAQSLDGRLLVDQRLEGAGVKIVRRHPAIEIGAGIKAELLAQALERRACGVA